MLNNWLNIYIYMLIKDNGCLMFFDNVYHFRKVIFLLLGALPPCLSPDLAGLAVIAPNLWRYRYTSILWAYYVCVYIYIYILYI